VAAERSTSEQGRTIRGPIPVRGTSLAGRDRGEGRIQRGARIVELRGFRTPSLEAVEHRRMRLWIVTTILLIGVSAGVAILS
jgi:hypothetical protein